jgi:hypothetical protein
VGALRVEVRAAPPRAISPNTRRGARAKEARTHLREDSRMDARHDLEKFFEPFFVGHAHRAPDIVSPVHVPQTRDRIGSPRF